VNLDRAFSRIGGDRDDIDVDALTRLLEHLGVEATDERLREAFYEAKRSDAISFGEFMAWWLRNEVSAGARNAGRQAGKRQAVFRLSPALSFYIPSRPLTFRLTSFSLIAHSPPPLSLPPLSLSQVTYVIKRSDPLTAEDTLAPGADPADGPLALAGSAFGATAGGSGLVEGAGAGAGAGRYHLAPAEPRPVQAPRGPPAASRLLKNTVRCVVIVACTNLTPSGGVACTITTSHPSLPPCLPRIHAPLTTPHLTSPHHHGRSLAHGQAVRPGAVAPVTPAVAMPWVSYRGDGAKSEIRGLQPNTLYHFKLRFSSCRSHSLLSKPLVLMTAPLAPATPPVITSPVGMNTVGARDAAIPP